MGVLHVWDMYLCIWGLVYAGVCEYGNWHMQEFANMGIGVCGYLCIWELCMREFANIKICVYRNLCI